MVLSRNKGTIAFINKYSPLYEELLFMQNIMLLAKMLKHLLTYMNRCKMKKQKKIKKTIWSRINAKDELNEINEHACVMHSDSHQWQWWRRTFISKEKKNAVKVAKITCPTQ